jgi:peptide/nickel transport system permease protein
MGLGEISDNGSDAAAADLGRRADTEVTEAALSFLGLGVPPTVPTWGGMLAESRDQLLAGNWWLAVLPGAAIMLTVLSSNVLGDRLGDVLDPRL